MSAKRKQDAGYVPASGELAGQRFKSRQAYRNALARLRGYANDYELRKARERANRREVLADLTEDQRFARERALEALGLMRSDGLSLRVAASRAQTTPRTVRKYAGPALRKVDGQYVAARSDNLLRRLAIPTSEGQVGVLVRSSRDASLLADYRNAVREYLYTGDTSALQRFRGKTITDANGKRWPLPTDERTLKRLARAGVVRFESIYREVA